MVYRYDGRDWDESDIIARQLLRIEGEDWNRFVWMENAL
jgi:hypothetical protein